MAAVSVVKGLVVALALAAAGACGPKTAAEGGSAGASSSSGASGPGSSSGAGQTGAGTSGASGATGSAASSDTGTAGATTGEPYMGPYHRCTKDEDCDDVVVDGVSGTCDIQPEGSICRPPFWCVEEEPGFFGVCCPPVEGLECSEEAKAHPDYVACNNVAGVGVGSCNPQEPSSPSCFMDCSPPQYPCPEPLVCSIVFEDFGVCVWPP